MTQLNETEIKEVVKERYGNLAREASAGEATSCCDDGWCGVDAERDVIMALYTGTDT